MIKKMLISAQDPAELRVALVEDGRLEAFYVETAAKEQSRGNIYKGIVVNIEPSLEAAFVDYGAERHGFLQINDIDPAIFNGQIPVKDQYSIKELLSRGQELLVQVVKEQTGNKGAALTTYLSIPGQSLVITRGRHLAGVSRKIESEAERKRLKEILGSFTLPAYLGIIARTASEGRSKRDLQSNCRLLLRLWADVEKRGKKEKAPALLHREEELAVRTVRDLFTSEVDEILVDNPEVFSRVKEFIALVNPRRQNVAKLYKEEKPIFHKYNIEQQLENIYQPRVNLPGGGSIVIQPTEALVSVDVNSGKAIKGREIEETALNVNQEAAAEIARQLRLRDLGGLVVVDFIDMRERSHQSQLLKVFKDELKKDKAKITLGRLSRFGLLELSRQRIRPPLDFGDTEFCSHCRGRGLVRTVEAVSRTIMRQLELKLKPGLMEVSLAPEMAHHLLNLKRKELLQLEQTGGARLDIKADPALALEEMRVAFPQTAAGLPVPEKTGPEPGPKAKAAPPQAPAAKEPAAAREQRKTDEAPADSSPEQTASAEQSKRNRRRRNSKKAPKSSDNAAGGQSPAAAEQAVSPEPAGAELQAVLSPSASPGVPEPKPKPRRRSAPKTKAASPEPAAEAAALLPPASDEQALPPEAAEEQAARKKPRRRRSGSARRRARKAASQNGAQAKEDNA